jgi:decaprenylphospho-beta-D-erythro-pentofuranosid-2-ulose 2-reductase
MKVLLIGGTSEIGLATLAALDLTPETEVILAGRDLPRLEAAAGTLACRQVRAVAYDATDVAGHQAFADSVCADGVPDLVIAAAGILIPQPEAEKDVSRAAVMLETNFTGLVTTLLALGAPMQARGSGTIVVLSSIAAVRPRRFNSVYGAAKAGLDAFARGYADSLYGSGVRLLLVRPGFVIGRMTAGMPRAPLATTPEKVGRAVAAALARPASRGDRVLWVPAPLAGLAAAMRLVPRPVWRKLDH